MPRTLIALVALLVAAGCSAGGERNADAPTPPPAAAEEDEFVPSWLSQTYSDGTLTIRYPDGWIENDTTRFGHVLSDNKSRTAAFVGVRYLPRREYADHAEFGELAVRLLRPPDGEGTILIATQAAKIGGRPGIEARVMWAISDDIPLGPTMRVIGIELPSGRVAVLVFAAESPTAHANRFAWIKQTATFE